MLVRVSMASEPSRKDPLERRATWALGLATVVLIFPSFGLSLIGGPGWWNIVLFVATQAALVFSVAASALTLAPQVGYLPQALRRRERPELLFWAFALLWAAMLLIALNISIVAIEALGENEF
jgi:nitrate reductase NapE component